MPALLIDAGPIVAVIDRSDDNHPEIAAFLGSTTDTLLTVWPAVTEAMHLLSFSWKAQEALWHLLESDAIRLLPLAPDDFSRMHTLMVTYRDLPMDLADAALVHVAEREGLRRILTLDQRDFRIYRPNRRGRFTVLPERRA